MGQVLAALALAVIGLVLLLVIAPFLLLGALAVLLLAWRRPAAVSRVTSHPRMSPVPLRIRSTPMRFASSLMVVAIALTATSVAIAGPPDPEPPVAEASSVPESSSPSPTATPTPEPTERPTARPTARPTPTPEPTLALGEEPTGPTETGVVVNVVDGDTIDVLVDGVEMRVRYIGMDTPEVHSGVEWLGPEASAANARLVEGEEVVLEKDVSETDQFGRALRYVWVRDGGGWLLVNLELIRLGYAQVTTYPPDVKYVDGFYLSAQEEARDRGVGMWGIPPTPQPTPVPTAAPTAAPAAPTAAPPAGNCHPSYSGYCVTAGIGDWDCAGGSGNGPNYLPVPVQVVGYDEYGLDADNDGWGCE